MILNRSTTHWIVDYNNNGVYGPFLTKKEAVQRRVDIGSTGVEIMSYRELFNAAFDDLDNVTLYITEHDQEMREFTRMANTLPEADVVQFTRSGHRRRN